jgi:uncharacterized protein YuzE
MIYAVDVPHATTYTYWVEADNEQEAIAKAKSGNIIDVEETGEVTGTTFWKKAKAREDAQSNRRKGKWIA